MLHDMTLDNQRREDIEAAQRRAAMIKECFENAEKCVMDEAVFSPDQSIALLEVIRNLRAAIIKSKI